MHPHCKMHCERFSFKPVKGVCKFRLQILDEKDFSFAGTMQGFPLRGRSAEGGDEVESQTLDFRHQTSDVKASNFDEIIRLPCAKGAGTTEGRD